MNEQLALKEKEIPVSAIEAILDDTYQMFIDEPTPDKVQDELQKTIIKGYVDMVKSSIEIYLEPIEMGE